MNLKSNLYSLLVGLLLGLTPFAYNLVPATTAVKNADLVQVVAPAEAEVGELVVLDASKSEAKSFKWIVKPETKNFRVDADGKQAVFSEGKPGVYTFYVAGASGDVVDADTVEVLVKGEVPGPGPGPVPQPQLLNVKDWVKGVKTANLKSEADALAASFEGVSAQIAAGVLKTPEQIIKSTAVANRGALGSSLESWKPFSDKLREALNKLSDDGKLSTPDDHVKVWKQIAKELDAVAKGA